MSNFEKLKKIAKHHIYTDSSFDFCLLGGEFKAVYKKREEFLDKVDAMIDAMDIRAIGSLPDEVKAKFPLWYRKNKYVIDYNKNGQLDFIKN